VYPFESEFSKKIKNGDFLEFEKGLSELFRAVQVVATQQIVSEILESESFRATLKKKAEEAGQHRLKLRPLQIQISTGDWITVQSWYAEKVKKHGSQKNRHIALDFWGFTEKGSPLYTSVCSIASVLCPSFEIGKQLLNTLNIGGSYHRIRHLSIELGKKGVEIGSQVVLKKDESVAGKRIVVQYDAGRSRLRDYKKEKTNKGRKKFKTPWRAPDLVVILVINEKGEVERKDELPFYDVTIDNIHKTLAKLTETLILLEAEKAKEVQFLGDGIPFLWKNIEQTFVNAGINPKKITYTLDYYHATEHLNDLIKILPKKEEKKQYQWVQKLKDYLWKGEISTMIDNLKRFCKEQKVKITKEIKNQFAYFEKHINHMQYKTFKEQKLLCGSGAVESAIRRIINLRFKNVSSFWLEEHLEPLCFLRATFLSGRWDIFLNNLHFRGDN
jgi:translation initiation factor IF-1